MYPTLEVRWFYQGAMPPAVLEWFQSAVQGIVVQPTRVDYYLRLPDNHSLGIKLREGRIEIKQRSQQHGLVNFHDGVAGLVESWRKWSLEVAKTGTGLEGNLEPASAWILVQKDRLLGKYRLTAGGQIVPIPASEPAGQGCEVELSNIQVGGEAWWTLALEASGQETTLQSSLLAGAGQLFRSRPPQIFSGLDSYSYPRWMATLPQLK